MIQKKRNPRKNKEVELKMKKNQDETQKVKQNNISEEHKNINRKKLELKLDSEIKINLEWYLDNTDVEIIFKTNSKRNRELFWGVCRENKGNQWNHIDKSYYPNDTIEFDAFTLLTKFEKIGNLKTGNFEQIIRIRFPKNDINTFGFVFKDSDSCRWYNNNNQDYYILLNKQTKKKMIKLFAYHTLLNNT